MAKKKSGNNMTKLIISIIVIALAVLTICTLFMNVLSVTGKIGILGFGTESTTAINGSDVFAAAFNGETSSDLTNGTNLLVGLKNSEDAGFVTNIFIWGYLITVIVAVATLVFAVLSMLGMKFKGVNTILGAVLAILAIVTFIFAIVVASKFSAENGISGLLSAGSKGSIAFGAYLLIATLICGAVQVYSYKK